MVLGGRKWAGGPEAVEAGELIREMALLNYCPAVARAGAGGKARREAQGMGDCLALAEGEEPRFEIHSIRRCVLGMQS